MAIDWHADIRTAKTPIIGELDDLEEAKQQASNFITSVVKPTFEAVAAEIKASYLEVQFTTAKSSGQFTVTLNQNANFRL